MLPQTKNSTLASLLAELKECGNLQRGRDLHMHALRAGHYTNKYIAASLVTIYSRCGNILHAQRVFDSLVDRNVVLWTSLILGYANNGKALSALELFTNMDCLPNAITFLAALKACVLLLDPKYQLEKMFCLKKGAILHKQARKLGLDIDIAVANSLLDMYSKLHSMAHVKASFCNMATRDTVSWNIVILGYAENGESLQALELFTCMDRKPDSFTFVAVLKALASLASQSHRGKEFYLEKGMAVHLQAKEAELDTNNIVSSSLLDMYTKCGSMISARVVFDSMTNRDVVSWTILILGYVERGDHSLALEHFASMDCEPSSSTYVAALKACAGLAATKDSDKKSCLEAGLRIHKRVVESGCDTNIFVSNTLVDMYSKCGSIAHARNVFNRMTNRDTVSWNVLLFGYVENGDSEKAIDLFAKMDCQPSVNTYVAVLKACGDVAELSAGQRVHAHVRKLGLEADQAVATSLVDFYAKCGDMVAAKEVFDKMQSRDTVSWSALISGYCALGDMSEVFSLMKRMQEDGFQPNNVTFLSVLTACSHGGMVEEGKEFFESMVSYGLKPSKEHFACLIDMLGRANRLQEALALVRDLEFEKSFVVWTNLCSKYEYVSIC